MGVYPWGKAQAAGGGSGRCTLSLCPRSLWVVLGVADLRAETGLTQGLSAAPSTAGRLLPASSHALGPPGPTPLPSASGTEELRASPRHRLLMREPKPQTPTLPSVPAQDRRGVVCAPSRRGRGHSPLLAREVAAGEWSSVRPERVPQGTVTRWPELGGPVRT